MQKKTDYRFLCRQLSAMIEDVPFILSNLANASALLYQTLADINWSGFYILENDTLLLGPFQGKPACTAIPVGKGVCGAAILQDKTQLVPDVHAFAGHIACDSISRSEIVIPLHKNGQLWGILDIDSPVYNRFSEADRAGLEEFCKILESVL